MAYTPINWQTGDTITAEKLNRCDNGWAVSSTQLFSETVTVVAEEYGNVATLAYTGTNAPDAMNITYDGTQYACVRVDLGGFYGYGDTDLTDPPFMLGFDGSSWQIMTETAGTHTVAVSTQSVDVSVNFSTAVAATGISPMFEIKSGVTTWQEAYDAVAAGKVAYFVIYMEEYGVDTIFPCYVSRVGISSHGDYEVRAAYVSSGNTVAVASLAASAADGVLS